MNLLYICWFGYQYWHQRADRGVVQFLKLVDFKNNEATG